MSAKHNAGNIRVVLITILCLLLVGLGAGAYLVFSNMGLLGNQAVNTPASQQPTSTINPNDKIKENVTIAGVSVSGMDKDDAQSAISAKADELLQNVKISFKVSGKQYDYAAKDLGVKLDADTLISEAFKADGKTQTDIEAKYILDTAYAKNKLTVDSVSMNVAAVDAKVNFTPNGKTIFTYVDEVNGANVKVDDLVSAINAEVQSGNYTVIDAPVEATPATVKKADLQLQTNKVVSFTSYYRRSNESSKNRIHNIAKLAGILNGTVIMPGDTFSVNKKAGPRTVERGWAIAHGIVDGRYEDQPGGGVCQVSGTLYNAALRAELDIVDRTHHSWPSTYLPKGLDATISTGAPDLKLRNPYDYPIYIMLSANVKSKSLTVEIYGKPRADGYKLNFISKQTESIPKPALQRIKATKTPEGTAIPAGGEVEYKEGHIGSVWKVYKQYIDKSGKVVKTVFHHQDTYKAFGQVIYYNPAKKPVTSPSASKAPASPSPSASKK